MGPGEQEALDHRWNCQHEHKDQQAAAKVGSVYADQDCRASNHAKCVIPKDGSFGIGIENQRGQQKKEEQKESVAG